MRRMLAIGALLFLSAGALACTYSVKKFNWMYPAGDSIGEIRLKRVFDEAGTDKGCGVFVSPNIKVKRTRLLVWELKNGCSAYYEYKVEIKDFATKQCSSGKGGSAAGQAKATSDVFNCKFLTGAAPPGTTGYLGCEILKGAANGCYSYAIYLDGKKAADPEVEIEN